MVPNFGAIVAMLTGLQIVTMIPAGDGLGFAYAMGLQKCNRKRQA